VNDIERAVEAMEDALANTVNAGEYPDGPCMDADVRDDLKAALAALRRYEAVEGCHDSQIDEFRRHVAGRDHECPALLLVQRAPETEETGV